MYSIKSLLKQLLTYKQRREFRFETKYKTVPSLGEKSRTKTDAQWQTYITIYLKTTGSLLT